MSDQFDPSSTVNPAGAKRRGPYRRRVQPCGVGPRLTASAEAVLRGIAQCIDAGCPAPSRVRLAGYVDCCRDSVRRALRQLEAAGLIATTHRPSRTRNRSMTNLYRLTPQGWARVGRAPPPVDAPRVAANTIPTIDLGPCLTSSAELILRILCRGRDRVGRDHVDRDHLDCDHRDCDRRDCDRRDWAPSSSDLARAAGCCRGTARRALRQLEAVGLIVTTQRPSRSPDHTLTNLHRPTAMGWARLGMAPPSHSVLATAVPSATSPAPAN